MTPLRLCHGKVELFISRPAHPPGWLVSWPSKRWSCLVATTADPSPAWLRSQGLGANQAEAVSEAWRRVVRPALEHIETLTGRIAKELFIPQPCPATRIGQLEQLVDLTRCADRALLIEALRALERQGRVLFSPTSENELVWWVTTPDDCVAPR